ncbi:MAG: class I tRNA ligase family protein [Candidatus Falkowbacteria bacterium]
MEFKPEEFEKKWQEKWESLHLYRADDNSTAPRCFVVDMFPYPSGSSMHVGHPRGYVATDVYSRFKRMSGFNVLHPMGWDAFGLPAEETAILNKEYPTVTVNRNIDKFKLQLTMLGLGYDWSREINTTDPKYYIQTQRIFLEFFKRGLAQNKTVAVNWCPELGTVLANEDIVDGKSERGGYPVYQQPMRQWILAITQYADRLVDDLELLPHWPEKIKTAQRNWIGRSEGHEFEFVTTAGINVPVFTTRLETLPGATFLVLAPDSEITKKIIPSAANLAEIKNYIEISGQKTDLDKQLSNEKTGVIIEGVTATNSFSNTQIPIVIADYVLSSYGTGAIMAVPAHDERDAEMAQVLKLPVVTVVEADKMINAGSLSGETILEARQKVSKMINATSQKRFKIRDWVFSRQRFWGEPFPIVWVEGQDNYELIAKSPVGKWLPKEPVSYSNEAVEYFAVPVLPEFLSAMRLPQVESYQATGTLEGPLAGISEWVNTFINTETGEVSNESRGENWIPALRETNTMPQWAGSSWYWLRYMDPTNETAPFSKESSKYWGPVNVYAGADHAVAHLIYARFWHKMMQDAGMVDFPEPFERLEFLGYILAADGTKISKRKGNSRSPEDIVKEVGADAFRLYETFIGPFEKPIPWSDNGLIGCRRFLEKIWRLAETVIEAKAEVSDPAAASSINKTIQKVGQDIETFKFNTAVSSMMICLNEIQKSVVSIADFKSYLALLAPFAPHMAEEIWSMSKAEGSIHLSSWPKVDAKMINDNEVTVAIQINGKHRSNIMASRDADEATIRGLVLNDDAVKKYLAGSELKKFIYVPGKIVSLII